MQLTAASKQLEQRPPEMVSGRLTQVPFNNNNEKEIEDELNLRCMDSMQGFMKYAKTRGTITVYTAAVIGMVLAMLLTMSLVEPRKPQLE